MSTRFAEETAVATTPLPETETFFKITYTAPGGFDREEFVANGAMQQRLETYRLLNRTAKKVEMVVINTRLFDVTDTWKEAF